MSEKKLKGCHFPKSVVFQCVYWYLRYALSYRDIEELMKERGAQVDHATIQRWVVKYTPMFEPVFVEKKRVVGKNWQMDECYIKIRSKWCYLHRAVGENGNTADFLLTAKRDKRAARRFLNKAIKNSTIPYIINIDKSPTNKVAIQEYNLENQTSITIQ